MTPGKVSTSRSLMHSRCFWAKFRTCAWANRMSSMSRTGTFAIVASISAGDRRKVGGDHSSNFSDSSRIAVSPRISTSVRIPSTVARTLASLAATSFASRPRFRCLAISSSLVQKGVPSAARPGQQTLRLHCRLNFGQLVEVNRRLALLTVDARLVGGLHHLFRQRLDRLARGWRAVESGLQAELGQEHRIEDLRDEGARHFSFGEGVASVFKRVALAELDLIGGNPGQ